MTTLYRTRRLLAASEPFDDGILFETKTDARSHATALRKQGYDNVVEKVVLVPGSRKGLMAALYNRTNYATAITPEQQLTGVVKAKKAREKFTARKP